MFNVSVLEVPFVFENFTQIRYEFEVIGELVREPFKTILELSFSRIILFRVDIGDDQNEDKGKPAPLTQANVILEPQTDCSLQE